MENVDKIIAISNTAASIIRNIDKHKCSIVLPTEIVSEIVTMLESEGYSVIEDAGVYFTGCFEMPTYGIKIEIKW